MECFQAVCKHNVTFVREKSSHPEAKSLMCVSGGKYFYLIGYDQFLLCFSMEKVMAYFKNLMSGRKSNNKNEGQLLLKSVDFTTFNLSKINFPLTCKPGHLSDGNTL